MSRVENEIIGELNGVIEELKDQIGCCANDLDSALGERDFWRELAEGAFATGRAKEGCEIEWLEWQEEFSNALKRGTKLP